MSVQRVETPTQDSSISHPYTRCIGVQTDHVTFLGRIKSHPRKTFPILSSSTDFTDDEKLGSGEGGFLVDTTGQRTRTEMLTK